MSDPATAESTTIARQCTLCEAQCGILVTVTGDEVTRIEGNPEDVLSHGYICPKATAMDGLHHDPDRLQPLQQAGNGECEPAWRRAHWITSVAWARTDWGMVIPRARAAPRLMMNSY